ncbi:metalloprotease m41 ftsh, putative [Perkinsus marinus ATCC 50983]|uniref:Metalloprotease m41 ftsh, putative n=1 Tax=Perkinsus marinus (strain ATCC 50983 / TXsc) TaxID=423536 RepID=C5L211_PERM5|nr:metalloprotease m41 ftsh, putative [Perkinsus marinus ATCC 50983]EER09204.1 metalloprotease m41 ftsh, putative [Perkinsus marinus ATCC 50983]|eukprot:XP_002777388.1 metalloprotease m41 ftsh, putative [Perkinsus marinus ATCC 50983]
MDFVTSALEVIGVNLHKDEREGRWKFDIDPLRLSGTVAGFGLAYVVMNRLEGHRTATPAVTITEVSEVPFSSFWKQLKDSQVDEIAFIPSLDGTMPPMLRYRTGNGEANQEATTLTLPGCSEMVADEAMKRGIRCYTSTEAEASLAMLQMMADLVGWTASLAGFLILYRMYSGDGVNGPFGAKKAPTANASSTKNVTKFADVAGHEQTKVELREIVQYLRDPVSFSSLGARPPLGVLLEGPSGVGKTLLGRATAGEANDIPFLYASGSEFVEVYVGQGAKRVREVFAQARAVSPCILFIDELDAIGSRNFRGGDGQEYTQTINQLLIEMDGISDRDGVVVMAATNRFDGLDSSLTRPGRFDRCIHVSLPDAIARERCFVIHGRRLKLATNVDNEALAAATEGMTGADIEHILNQAALVAARNKETCVSQERILEASDKLRAERSERNKRQQQKVDEDRHAEIPFDRWAAQTLINLANNTQRDSPEVD